MSVSFAHDSENLFDTKAGTARGWQKTENSCLKIRDDLRAAPGFGAGRGKISCGKAGRQRGCSAWGEQARKGEPLSSPARYACFWVTICSFWLPSSEPVLSPQGFLHHPPWVLLLPAPPQ